MLSKNLRRLIRTMTGYSLNTLIGPLFTILLTPLYAAALGTNGYGTVDTLMILAHLLLMFGLLGMNSALSAFYFDSQEPKAREKVASSAVWLVLLWSCLIAALIFFTAGPVTYLSVRRTDVVYLTEIIAITLPFSVLYSIQTTLLRLKTAVWRANILAFLYIIVFAASNVTFIVLLDWGSQGVFWSYLVTYSSTSLAALALAPDAVRSWPSFSLMRKLSQTGALLVPTGLAVWLLVYIDRPIMIYLGITTAQIGIYAMAYKLASMLAVALQAFYAAWLPFAMEIKDSETAPRTYSKVLTYFAVLGLGLALCISLFSHEVFVLFTTPDFLPAENYVWLLALVPLTSGMHSIVTVGLYISKRLGQLNWTVSAAAAANIALNLLLIPFLGVMGAAVATAVGYVLSPLLSAFVAQRVHPFPFEWGRVLRIFVVYLLLSGCGVFLGSRTEVMSLLLRAGLLFSYVPLLIMLRTFEPWELQLARKAVLKPRYLLRWITHS